MIQLKDLDMEMTEVLEGDLGFVVGGDSYHQKGFVGLNGVSGEGATASWKIKNTSTTVGAASNGTLSVDTNLNSNLQFTGAVNVNNGASKANVIYKPTDSLSVGVGGKSDGSLSVGLGYSY
jgi:hypothetical protein